MTKHVYGRVMSGMKDVYPPLVLAGGKALAFVNGLWEPCVVHSVRIHRKGVWREWIWQYNVTVRGVHVTRYSDDGLIAKDLS